MPGTEPLKLALDAAACGWTGRELAGLLRTGGAEAEYADVDYVVLMASGSTTEEDFRIAADAISCGEPKPAPARPVLPVAKGERVMSIREALFAPHETVSARQSLGHVCGAPTVACPPAIPIAVSGERIGPEAVELFARYGVERVEVLREKK